LAFNACIRYVYNLRRFDHISEYVRGILGCDLFTYLEIRLAVFIHRVHLSSVPAYLGSHLRLGSSLRHRLFVAPGPTPITSMRNNSTIFRGIRLWNCLPAIAKESRSISRFKREAEQFLVGLAESTHSRRHHHHHHHQTY
jgi:hypothetical protein